MDSRSAPENSSGFRRSRPVGRKIRPVFGEVVLSAREVVQFSEKSSGAPENLSSLRKIRPVRWESRPIFREVVRYSENSSGIRRSCPVFGKFVRCAGEFVRYSEKSSRRPKSRGPLGRNSPAPRPGTPRQAPQCRSQGRAGVGKVHFKGRAGGVGGALSQFHPIPTPTIPLT